MDSLESNRSGLILAQTSGYSAFVPNKLASSSFDIKIDNNMIVLLSEADRSLGELVGMTRTIPNPDLFVAYYVKKEALLSSQIEGTQCSLDDVIQVDYEKDSLKPVNEVVNYIKAMNTGLEKLKKIPLSLRLIHDIHKVLLSDVRGQEKTPGEYKRSQNWIGPAGCNLNEAAYVPPPPNMVMEFMGDWENYFHMKKDMAPLIEAAILHAHFETIHPYLDGNGRLGRLLITFMLCERKVLVEPLLYLSLFFKKNRTEYYQLLMNIRFKGEWEEWIRFFLRGVRETSEEAIETALDIQKIITKDYSLINEKLSRYSTAVSLHNFLCLTPILNVSMVKKQLSCSYPAAKNIIDQFIKLDILKLYNGDKKRNRMYCYHSYLEIMKRGT